MPGDAGDAIPDDDDNVAVGEDEEDRGAMFDVDSNDSLFGGGDDDDEDGDGGLDIENVDLQ